MKRTLYRSGWFALPLLAAAACSTTTPQQTALMRSEGVTYVSASELRVRVRALAPELSGIIEEVGTEILMEHGDEPTYRQATRVWLTNAIPEIQRSLYQPDPLAAFVDAAAYVAQSTLFFAEGRGADLPPDLRAAGLEACTRLRSRMTDVIIDVDPNPDPDEVWRLVDDWAMAHPIDSSFTARSSTAGLLAELTSRPGHGGLRVVGQLGEQLGDVAARLDLYVEYLPKLARWQGLIAVEEALIQYDIDDALAGAASVPIESRRFADMVPAERELILAAVASEGEMLRGWARTERLATLAYMTDERKAVLTELTAEREAVLVALQLERQVILEAVRAEREVVLAELREIAHVAMVDARDEIIDHAFWRLSQLAAVGYIAVAVLVIATALILRRR